MSAECPPAGVYRPRNPRATPLYRLVETHYDEVLDPVCHRMWTFTVPKMLRPYFLHHQRLLGKLCRAAYETVHELMASAAIGVEDFRTGMVAAVHLSGDLLTLNPHVHALAPRGGWDPDGSWVPVPFVDERCAELLFRKKVLDHLASKGIEPGRGPPGEAAAVPF